MVMGKQLKRLLSALGSQGVTMGLLAFAMVASLVVFAPVNAWAYGIFGFGPSRYQTTQQYGEGIYYAPYTVELRESPSETAPIVETLKWTKGSKSLSVFSETRQIPIQAHQAFVCYYPELDVAMMPVVSENGEGWVEVVYDQGRHKTGWVKVRDKATIAAEGDTVPRHFGQFQSWLQFMRMNARHHGIYWLDGVDPYYRALRSKPEDGSPFIETMYMKDIRVIHARGNWLLIECKDFGEHQPVGWVRWRDEDGKLMVFTNFTGGRTINITGY